MNENFIEIIVSRNSSYLESLTRTWKSNDLYFTMDYDYHEQMIFSAYSPHIENLRVEKDLIKRIVSLNILVNGSLFISAAAPCIKVEFQNYHIENSEINDEIEKGAYSSFWSDTIEEYPFDKDEEFYLEPENRNLPKNADLETMLFSISKFDFFIRALLFQAGIIFNNGINDKILTWNTLYKMVDTIKAGCSEIQIDYKTLIDETSLEKFTAACNNPTVTGVYSRHGGTGKAIKKVKPITDLDEAIKLILCFANRFTKKYVTTKGYITINNPNLSKCEHQV